jgi:hypothetical protein
MSSAALEDGSIVREADSLLSLFQGALAARSQLGWSRWLQVEMHKYLPHDAVIAAWGDFKAGVLAYDVITRSPDLSAHSMPKNVVIPLMATLFQRWLVSDQQPLVIEGKDLPTGCPTLASLSRCALVHGIKDHRSRYDCIYLFLGSAELGSPFSRQLCRVALPSSTPASGSSPIAARSMSWRNRQRMMTNSRAAALAIARSPMRRPTAASLTPASARAPGAMPPPESAAAR